MIWNPLVSSFLRRPFLQYPELSVNTLCRPAFEYHLYGFYAKMWIIYNRPELRQ